MPVYKKGIESKEKIYQSAKKMFHEYGYKKTTIEKIAEDAEVPVGLVTYYFKKESILSQIYQEYMKAIIDCIEEQVGGELTNHLQKHLLISQIFYSRLVCDEGNKEVYREIFLHRLISEDVYGLITRNMMRIAEEFSLEMDEVTFHQMTVAEFGARRELLSHRYEDLHPVRDKSFFYFLSTIAARLAGVKPELIEENIVAADRILKKIDINGVKFLV